MRITELLEGKKFDDLEFVQRTGDKDEINFDLPDDLSHFMHNNDDVYRTHVYPVIAKCLHLVKTKQDFRPSVFEKAAKECYRAYLQEYPIRHLPDDLDKGTCKKVCEKLFNEFKQHHADGLYKG